MKTTMKLFAAITIILGFSLTGLSQGPGGTSSNTIAANATVVSTAVVAGLFPLEFGTLARTGGAKTVSVLGVASGNTTTPGTVQRGQFSVARTATTTNLAITFPTDLVSGAFTLPFSSGTATCFDDNAGGGTPIPFVSGLASIPAANTTATVYVNVGGTVTPNASTQEIATYTGTITLTATYN